MQGEIKGKAKSVGSSERAALAPVKRLSDPEIKAQLVAEVQAMQARPALAKAFLLEVGIITPKTGKLTKRFGG